MWGARCLLLCFEGASENNTTGLSHLRCPRAIDFLYSFERVVKHADKERAIEAPPGLLLRFPARVVRTQIDSF